ncbi:MAG: response regulator [Pontiellaceae bacterium]|nr:response regulator [Pontiellaceae bacterium]
MKILIVEDNAFSQALLKKTILKAGYDPVVAENGETAWEILQGEDPPKLALVDWMMPGLSGVGLCRKVREQDNSALPVYMILLTAKSNKEDVLEGFAAGADDFIKKPFDTGELIARIKVGLRLVEQQALLHGLIDSLPDPVYVKDHRGLYLRCNKAYAEFVGMEPYQIRGHSSWEIVPGEKGKKIHQDDLGVVESGLPRKDEGWVQSANGVQVFHDAVRIPYLASAVGASGMIGIFRDLTRRMELQQELRRLAVAVEQSAESIMITDVKGKIQYVNTAFEETTGYSSREAIGQTPALLKSGKHDAAFMAKLWETITAGDTWDGRLVNRHKDGHLFGVEAMIYPIRDSQGTLVNFVSIGRDISREAAIEKHLRQQQKMNAIGELAGGVSHDFNNILTAILGYVALGLSCVKEGSNEHKYLTEILKAGERAAKLVRQILAFSRQEEPQFHSLELQEVIEDSLSLVRTNMEGIELEKDVDPNCGPILGDTTQLQQVIINLCSNAVHAIGEDNEGTIKVGLHSVMLVHDDPVVQAMDLISGPYACITVSDTGCGMSLELQERIFEPYFSTKKAGEGSGFGLSIVHGIVQRHRGCIQVESEEGAGTTFTIYLPLLEDEVGELPVAGLKNTASEKVGGRVLFVDDESTILTLGREILESYGYHVTTATNGKLAWNMFRKAPENFDALITDYRMPKMNGYELIKNVKSLRDDIPIVLCSGYMEKVEGEGLMDLEDTLYMAKPIDWRMLNKALKNGTV